MAVSPWERFGLPFEGATLWDLKCEYAVDPACFLSLGKATPFEGWQVFGECLLTLHDGRAVYKGSATISNP